MARLSLKHLTAAKSRKPLFAGIALALALCLAMPAFALATAGSSVQASSFTASSKEAVAGQKVTFSVTIQQPQNATSAYAYLRSTDGTQQQVSMRDTHHNGVFEGELTIGQQWSEGAWQCTALQVYTDEKSWGYLRDKRSTLWGSAADLSAFDLVVSETSADINAPLVDEKSLFGLYSDGVHTITLSASDATGIESVHAYFVTPEKDQLQVKLNDNGNGTFTGTFPCSSETALATWRCKAIQTCDIIGNWGYVRDERFYEQGGTDLSALDAVVCLHEWDDWIITKSPTCQEEGSEKRVCSLCGRFDLRTLPKSDHLWIKVITEVKPTQTTEGTGHRACIWCDATLPVDLPALGPYSCYDYAPGIYLVRFFPDQPATGRALFRQQGMFWVPSEQCWATLTKENPGELTQGDFTFDGSAEVPPAISRPESESGMILPGDLNDSGTVNIVDVQIAYYMATGVYTSLQEPPLDRWLAADVNSDGFLDAVDVFLIQNLIVLR